MTSQFNALPGHKRTRFLAIPHSRSMHDLHRQAIPPSRTCVSATYHPAYAYPTRPVSFCPASTPVPQEPDSASTNNRRFSELPVQLDLGLPFGSLLDGETFSLAKGHHSSHAHDSPGAFPNLSRLSHYQGTSSSSGLSERAILSIENSSFTSSACTAPTSPIDSDGTSSFYECVALDFPDPPPIGSPVIRRMRSSPWFLSADEVDGVLSVPGRGGRVALDRLGRQSRISSMGLKAESIKQSNNLEYLKKNPLGFYGDHVAGAFEINSPVHDGSFRLQNSAFLDTRLPSTLGEKLFRQYDLQSGGKKDNTMAVSHTESSFGGLPRIIRKVASMRSDLHKAADAPNNSTVTFQKPVPRVRSFRSILRDSEGHNEPPITTSKQDFQQLNKRNFFWKQIPKTKIAGKDKQRRQSSGRAVYANNLLGTSSTALGWSSGTNWKDDLNKSFIDISPDRNVRSKGRRIMGKERMRSLLSKANEIFSWGWSQKKAPLPQGP